MALDSVRNAGPLKNQQIKAKVMGQFDPTWMRVGGVSWVVAGALVCRREVHCNPPRPRTKLRQLTAFDSIL